MSSCELQVEVIVQSRFFPFAVQHVTASLSTISCPSLRAGSEECSQSIHVCVHANVSAKLECKEFLNY